MSQDERQASADEIVSGEVNNAMLAAGMRAHAAFMRLPEERRAVLGMAQLVAEIYGAMEATRRHTLAESSAEMSNAL